MDSLRIGAYDLLDYEIPMELHSHESYIQTQHGVYHVVDLEPAEDFKVLVEQKKYQTTSSDEVLKDHSQPDVLVHQCQHERIDLLPPVPHKSQGQIGIQDAQHQDCRNDE